MKTVVSVLWFLCSMVLATKWYSSGEKRVIRRGRAMDRMQSKFWDWCYYMFLSLLVMAVPFGIILRIMKGAGIIMKYVIIVGAVGIVIYVIYCAVNQKRTVQENENGESTEEEQSDEYGRIKEEKQESRE